MNGDNLFRDYERLAAKADSAFQRVEKEHPSCINCATGCTDCCYSVFGLFLIESVYLKYHFDKLSRKLRREAVLRGNKAGEELAKIQKKMEKYNDDPRMLARAAGRERVRCPLLNDEGKCILYPYRPVTCRVYGIPTVSGGEVRVCGKAGFKKGESYPTFNLDKVFKDLYQLSRKLLEKSGQKNMDRASLLVSVPKTITTPLGELVKLP